MQCNSDRTGTLRGRSHGRGRDIKLCKSTATLSSDVSVEIRSFLTRKMRAFLVGTVLEQWEEWQIEEAKKLCCLWAITNLDAGKVMRGYRPKV